MLLAFTALIALLNAPLIWLGDVTGVARCSAGRPTWARCWLRAAPIAWVIGVPWQDATTVGGLIGRRS
jgi:CNT family concentrative nucleoside transporter